MNAWLKVFMYILQTDMQVRDKILILLDSWQEAFGGPNGKYPQYSWACQELRVFCPSFPLSYMHVHMVVHVFESLV